MDYEYLANPIKCEACGETITFPYPRLQIGDEIKCTNCGTSRILQRKDIKKIEFLVTLDGTEEHHLIEINHEKRKLIPKGRVMALKHPTTPLPRNFVIEKYEEIKRELENDPDWKEYSFIEDYMFL